MRPLQMVMSWGVLLTSTVAPGITGVVQLAGLAHSSQDCSGPGRLAGLAGTGFIGTVLSRAVAQAGTWMWLWVLWHARNSLPRKQKHPCRGCA